MITNFTLTTFTPGEAENITGVTTALQRDWRRRGFLASTDGHARFQAFTLTEMWVLKLLSDRGIGPQEGARVAEICARGIVFWALRDLQVYEGDHDAVCQWKYRRTPRALIEKMRDARARDMPVIDPEKHQKILKALGKEPEHSVMWGDAARWMAERIIRNFCGVPVVPARFFIWWADGEHGWHSSVDEAFKQLDELNSCKAGPVVVLDLVALSGSLLDLVDRPLVHVEFDPNADEEDRAQ